MFSPRLFFLWCLMKTQVGLVQIQTQCARGFWKGTCDWTQSLLMPWWLVPPSRMKCAGSNWNHVSERNCKVSTSECRACSLLLWTDGSTRDSAGWQDRGGWQKWKDIARLMVRLLGVRKNEESCENKADGRGDVPAVWGGTGAHGGLWEFFRDDARD